jgi:acylphosphatase
MKRAIVIATGKVQKVNYRDAVGEIARKLKITGFVENLKPYEKFPIEVEAIEVRLEDFKGEFKYFEIKMGEWGEEIAERLDTAGKLLYKSAELGEISVQLSGESVEVGKKMLDKLDNFHQDTMQRFDSLDVKYGGIAENMERILEDLKEERKEYRKSIEKLVNAIIESRKGGGAKD